MLVGAGYDNFFKQAVINNCDIIIRDTPSNSGTVLLTGTNFNSFEMTRENTIVPEKVPYDVATIEIKDWASLDLTVQNALLTEEKAVYVFFQVENVETETVGAGILFSQYGHIDFIIRECKVSLKHDTATLKLVSPYEGKDKTKLSDLGYHGASFQGGKTAPYKVSITEARQQLRLLNGNIMSYESEYNAYYLNKLSINYYDAMIGMSSNNVIGNIDYHDTNDNRENIVAVGMKGEGDTITLTKTATPSSPSATSLTCYYDVDQQYIVTQAQCFVDPSWRTLNFSVSSRRISATTTLFYTYPSSTTFRFYVKKAVADYPTDDSIQNFAVCKYLITEVDADKLAEVQTALRTFYSHKRYYEFDCRLDPRIEPTDNLYVPDIGIIKVEAVRMSFNGGFTGHIKGRYVGNITLQPVTITEKSFGTLTFSFKINNPNNRKVNAVIHDTRGNVITKEIDANSSYTCTSVNTILLLDDIIRYNNGNLTSNIYIETVDYDMPALVASQNTVLCYGMLPPEVLNVEYHVRTGSGAYNVDYTITILNPNDFTVTLYIKYSGGSTINFLNIPPHAVISLDQTTASQLQNSFNEKSQGDLADDIFCYFQYYVQSKNTIILRDDL